MTVIGGGLCTFLDSHQRDIGKPDLIRRLEDSGRHIEKFKAKILCFVVVDVQVFCASY